MNTGTIAKAQAASNATGTSSTSANTTTKTTSQLNLNTFINLLVAELQHQDPTQPMKDTDYMSQLSNLGTLNALEDLQKNSTISQGTTLLGKTVQGSATDGSIVTGTVTRSWSSDGKYYVTVHDGTKNTDTDIELKTVSSVK